MVIATSVVLNNPQIIEHGIQKNDRTQEGEQRFFLQESGNIFKPDELPAGVPIEECRQESFEIKNNKNMDPNTSSSTLPLASETGNAEIRESPPARTKVRFNEGETILQQSESTMVTPHQMSTNSKTLADSTSSPTPSPILSSKAKHKASSSTRPSVFERLSKTETVASIHQKFLPQQGGEERRRMKRSTSAPPSLRMKHDRRSSRTDDRKSIQKTSKKETEPNLAQRIVLMASSSFDLFERLSEKHTALSESRRRPRSETKTNNNKSSNNNKPKKKTIDRSKPKRSSSLGRRHSRGKRHDYDPWKSKPKEEVKTYRRTKTRSRKARDFLDDAFDEASEGLPLEIEFSSGVKITCSNKFMPEDGFEELDSFELGLNGYIVEYEEGGISVKDFATEIMKALLWRDLPTYLKWEVSRPLERELAMPIGEIGYSYMIEASGKKIIDDEDDLLSEEEEEEEELHIASVTGNITFLPDGEIQVENYSCIHDADGEI